jgi:DNA topoisomerase-1
MFDAAGATFADPNAAARKAGLRYVCDETTAGLSRARHGAGFRYFDADGKPVRDRTAIARIRALAIPPAWTSIWISPDPHAHLLATGRDAKGRKQYRYNSEFVAVRDAAKFDHLVAFGQTLPRIRTRVDEHMALAGMPREKVLATVIALLEATLIRVGNEDYARQNGSFGLTTLRNRHVRVVGSELRFVFHGKSGKSWRLSLRDRRVAKIIRACQELPGQHLFQYRDAEGAPHKVSSGDVNDYLRDASGRDVTAKDFRTWAGTVEAAAAFRAYGAGPPLKKNVREVISRVAEKLGNTPTVCRKCYIHPAIPAAYEAGTLILHPRRSGGLAPMERAVLMFLKTRARSG